MPDVMVIKQSPELDGSVGDFQSALGIVKRGFRFLEQSLIEEDSEALLVVSARADHPNSKPQPIRWKDYMQDTLNPIFSKASRILGNKKVCPKEVMREGTFIIFVFSSSSSKDHAQQGS